jgi:NADPH-dependent 2,4-dienoyl-CoA reductase/sulfur reductase-like enzyme
MIKSGIQKTELAVIGAGPAGLEAALAAAEAGVEVVLIDRYSRPGGQYFRQPLEASTGSLPAEAQALFQRLAGVANLRWLGDTLVWGAFPADSAAGWLLTLAGPEGPPRLQAETLVLATGAYDRPMAFPGWTLPGVMTDGAAQTLLKSQRVLPGRRFLLSGSGPLQLALAAQLVQAGAEVVAVLEGTTISARTWLSHSLGLWGQGARLAEGWRYWRTLRQAKVPYRFGWAVVEACGQDEVEAAIIAQLDDHWQPLAATHQVVQVDTVLLGYGFLPATQLSRLLNCRHQLNLAAGGPIPSRDEWLQTSCAGVYAAGDGAGLGGVAVARLEGRLAGLAAARRLGRLNDAAARAAAAAVNAALKRERRFAALLGRLCTPGPGLYTLATPETPLCRCEEVRLADIQRAVQDGAQTINEVKGATRAGMGNCQGRMCGELVARAMVQALDRPGDLADRLEAAGSFSVRPPLEPLPLSVLAEAADVV